jgi:hypothetical protein
MRDPCAAELGGQQLRLVESARAFLLAEEQRGVDVAIAPECYLNGWARVLGSARLRVLAGSRLARLNLLVARVREAVLVATRSGYELISERRGETEYGRLIVSWCRRADFSPDGSYVDRYFRLSSRATPTTFWLLIALDDAVPESLQPNIAIFRRRPGTPRIDYLHLLQSVVDLFRRRRARSRNRSHVPALSAAVSFAEQVTQAVMTTLNALRIECILMPYEAQPFQHAVYRAAKMQNGRVITVGYLHSALPPLPTDLIHRAGAPELLFVHGAGQIDILARYLDWPRGALREIASLRYRAGDAGTLSGLIFLPYFFDRPRLIEGAFRDFLLGSAPGSLSPLVVRNHPVMDHSRPHLRLKRALEKLMLDYADRFSEGEPARISVFVGATAAILEALERGVDTIHICAQPLTESHSTAIWRGLSVDRLGEYVFRYRLEKRGTYIVFGAEGDSVDNYLESTTETPVPQ